MAEVLLLCKQTACSWKAAEALRCVQWRSASDPALLCLFSIFLYECCSSTGSASAARTEELSFPEASKQQPKKTPNQSLWLWSRTLLSKDTIGLREANTKQNKTKQNKNQTSSLLPWDQLQILLLAAGNAPPSHKFSSIIEIKSRPKRYAIQGNPDPFAWVHVIKQKMNSFLEEHAP